MQFLTNIDLSKNELQNAKIQNLATAPTNPEAGQVYYNSTSKKLFVYNGSTWIDMTIVVENPPANGVIRINGVDTTVYSHPTSDGNLHVPATGTSNNGKVLKAGATSGSLSWGTLTAGDVGALPATSSAVSAEKLRLSRSISLGGHVTGSALFDGSTNITINASLSSAMTDAIYSKETPTGSQAKADAALASANMYTDTKVSALVNSAPGVLDTLEELAAALGDDPNFATTMTNLINARTRKYTATIGSGSSNTVSVTHGLNSADVVVSVREVSSNNVVFCDVAHTSANVVTLTFAKPPELNQYRVVVVG